MADGRQSVEAHYGRGDLAGIIEGALKKAGKDMGSLAPADLAAIDEFHVRGRAASLELAAQMGLDDSMHVLDIGSGVGGGARLLAAEYGCRVTGIDLTEAYCRAATTITGWVGLDKLVDYRQGDALALPFADASFDAAWTQHTAMNIADKPAMYAEAHRVLRPGGPFAVYDILQGAGGEVLYPVPWAQDPAISFLVTPEAMRELLTGAGFEIVAWRDTTSLGRDWFQEIIARAREGGPPPLGWHLLLGPVIREMGRNQGRNLAEGRIALIEAVCRRA